MRFDVACLDCKEGETLKLAGKGEVKPDSPPASTQRRCTGSWTKAPSTSLSKMPSQPIPRASANLEYSKQREGAAERTAAPVIWAKFWLAQNLMVAPVKNTPTSSTAFDFCVCRFARLTSVRSVEEMM